jgi:hypothetical protein
MITAPVGIAPDVKTFFDGPQLSLDLTDKEVSTLTRCEAVIEEGRAAFLKVGSALLVIRDERLYRKTHTSFEAYLSERWGMGKANAYRLIDAFEIVQTLEASGAETLPQNESQARPLAALPEEQRQGAWAAAVEAADGQPTAAEVQAAVSELLPVKEEAGKFGPSDYDRAKWAAEKAADTLEAALKRVLPKMVGNVTGLSDKELREAIASEFYIEGGSSGPSQKAEYHKGGPDPAFWFDSHGSGPPTLTGKALVDKVRAVMSIPYPSQPALLDAPEAPAQRFAAPGPVPELPKPEPVIVPARRQHPEAPSASLMWQAAELEDFEAALPALVRVRQSLIKAATVPMDLQLDRAMAVIALNLIDNAFVPTVRDAVRILRLNIDADVLLMASTPGAEKREMLAHVGERALLFLCLEVALRDDIYYNEVSDDLDWLHESLPAEQETPAEPVAEEVPNASPEFTLGQRVEAYFAWDNERQFSPGVLVKDGGHVLTVLLDGDDKPTSHTRGQVRPSDAPFLPPCADCHKPLIGFYWVDPNGITTDTRDPLGQSVCFHCQETRWEGPKMDGYTPAEAKPLCLSCGAADAGTGGLYCKDCDPAA